MTRAYVPAALRRQVIADAAHRCGYCWSDETLTGIPLTIEHIVPASAGGATTRDNLWLSCNPCNEFKSNRLYVSDPDNGEVVPLFNPRTQDWHEHFAWSEDATQMIGLTPIGRATISAVQLNRSMLVKARRRWITAGWHPPQR